MSLHIFLTYVCVWSSLPLLKMPKLQTPDSSGCYKETGIRKAENGQKETTFVSRYRQEEKMCREKEEEKDTKEKGKGKDKKEKEREKERDRKKGKKKKGNGEREQKRWEKRKKGKKTKYKKTRN